MTRLGVGRSRVRALDLASPRTAGPTLPLLLSVTSAGSVVVWDPNQEASAAVLFTVDSDHRITCMAALGVTGAQGARA